MSFPEVDVKVVMDYHEVDVEVVGKVVVIVFLIVFVMVFVAGVVGKADIMVFVVRVVGKVVVMVFVIVFVMVIVTVVDADYHEIVVGVADFLEGDVEM